MEFTPEMQYRLMTEILFSLAEKNGGRLRVEMTYPEPERMNLELHAEDNSVTVYLSPQTIH